MFRFNNTHIFTGYIKQKLSTVQIPVCKIYTREFYDYLEAHGEEDPRVIESFGIINNKRSATYINYLKSDSIYNYICEYDNSSLDRKNANWKCASSLHYDEERYVYGLTKSLKSEGRFYDKYTHEYLGEYLRFIRDYYDINLMPLYNCFNDSICNNINFSFKIESAISGKQKEVAVASENQKEAAAAQIKAVFNSQDTRYKIYAIPVKLFANYTIAIDCGIGIEMFCGFYNTTLDLSQVAVDLIKRTYTKINKTVFNRPFLFDKLDVKNWNTSIDTKLDENGKSAFLDADKITRWDVAAREQDLKLFIKVPSSCKSSITVLEGDFRSFNDHIYSIGTAGREYKQNHCAINFGSYDDPNGYKINLNNTSFTPIGKLQLLAFNTGESYPFSDRLIEYLSGSAITPIDEISDNIKRAQKVMNNNGYHFKIEGLWEDKMQKIIYDYMINAGPIKIVKGGKSEDDKLTDKHHGHNPKGYGYHPTLGHKSKSTLFDVLGFIDKDAEKWYSSWTIDKNNRKAAIKDNIQNVDIYNGLYDI